MRTRPKKRKSPPKKRGAKRPDLAPAESKPTATGRPPLEIDEGLVGKLASLLCTMAEIAATVGCSVDTLERRFAEVIEKGRERGKASLRRQQFLAAQKGNATMLIWLGKQYLGQKDKVEVETKTDAATAHAEAIRKRRESREKTAAARAAGEAVVAAGQKELAN